MVLQATPVLRLNPRPLAGSLKFVDPLVSALTTINGSTSQAEGGGRAKIGC